MKTLLLIVLVLFSSQGLLLGETTTPSLSVYDMSFEELANLSYSTAAKRPLQLKKMPNIFTVITKEELDKKGITTLKEALTRVGFYSGPTQYWDVVGYRGIIQDQNTSMLLLIDGDVTNSSLKGGFGQMHLFPVLSKVDRIEIIRNPSSTLWGGKALLGVINIITRDEDGVRFSTGFDEFNKRNHQSLHLGDQGDWGSFSLHYTQFKSSEKSVDHYPTNATEGLTKHPYLKNEQNYFPFSHEVHSKLSLSSFEFIFHYSDFKTGSRDMESNFNSRIRDGMEHYRKGWITAQQTQDFSDSWQLISKFHYNKQDFLQLRKHIGPIPESDFSRTWREYSLGFEQMLHWMPSAEWDSLFGWEYKHLNWSTLQGAPGQRTEFVPDGSLDQRAAYFDSTWSPNSSWDLTTGLRYDQQNSFATEGALLPRFAAHYYLDNYWSLLYTFNTGLVRPTVEQA